MKLNVKKYQQGGIFSSLQLPNYLLYQPAPGMGAGSSQGSSSEGSSKSKSKKDDDGDFKLLSQKVVDELITKGLPNEVSYFLSELAEYEQSNNGIFSASTSRAKLYSLANLASNMLNNRKEYDKAVDLMKANESFSDYAVSNDGGVYVTDIKNGKTKHISLSEYKKHEDKYNVLTYGDLLESRAYEPDSRFKSNIFTTLKESVGVHKIAQNIQEIVKMLGSNEVTKEDYVTANEAFGIRMQQMTPAEKEAMQLLNNYASLGDDALFKFKITEKGYSDANAALKYIYSVLPENQKKQLMANYIINGGEDNNPVNVIKNAIMMSEDKKSDYSIDLDETAASRQKSKSDKTRNTTMMEMFFNGDLNQETVNFTDPTYNNKYQISLKGNVIPSLVTDNNNGVATAPLLYALDAKGKGMGKYLDYNNIYVGGVKTTSAALNDMLYNQGQVAKVWVPTDGNGNIDFNSLTEFGIIQQQIEKEGLQIPKDLNKINKKLADAGLSIRLNEKGEFTSTSHMEEFLLTYAYSNNGNLTKNNQYIRKIKGKEESDVMNLFDQIFKVYKMESPINSVFANNTFQAPVLIRVNKHAAINAQAFAGHGSLMNPGTLEDNMLRQELEPEETMIGNSSLLFQ